MAVSVTSIAGLLAHGMRRGPPHHATQRVSLERMGHGIQVMDDGLTVAHTFSGNGADGGRIVGDVQTCLPLETNHGVGYYEVEVRQMHDEVGLVVLGVGYGGGVKHPSSERATRGLCAYRSDTGQFQTMDDARKPYAWRFAAGDVVGCGICRRTREIWFTKNGKYLGTADTLPGIDVGHDQFYPTVLLDRSTVVFNFDPSTFKWSPAAKVKEEEAHLLDDLDRTPVPKPHAAVEIIASYLLHYGYTDTLDALAKRVPELRQTPLLCKASPPEGTGDVDMADDTGHGAAGEAENSRVALRAELNRTIMAGEIEKAMAMVSEKLPDVRTAAWPHLVSQQVVELVHAGKPLEAVAAARDPLWAGEAAFHPVVAEAMGLLAYPDPGTSPLQHLLSPARRRAVADAVNAAILHHSGYARDSVVESMVKHALTMPLIARECLCPLSSSSAVHAG